MQTLTTFKVHRFLLQHEIQKQDLIIIWSFQQHQDKLQYWGQFHNVHYIHHTNTELKSTVSFYKNSR